MYKFPQLGDITFVKIKRKEVSAQFLLIYKYDSRAVSLAVRKTEESCKLMNVPREVSLISNRNIKMRIPNDVIDEARKLIMMRDKHSIRVYMCTKYARD